MKEKLGRLHPSIVFAASWAGVAIFSWLFLSWTSSWFSEGLSQLLYAILFWVSPLTFWQSFWSGVTYGKKWWYPFLLFPITFVLLSFVILPSVIEGANLDYQLYFFVFPPLIFLPASYLGILVAELYQKRKTALGVNVVFLVFFILVTGYSLFSLYMTIDLFRGF